MSETTLLAWLLLISPALAFQSASPPVVPGEAAPPVPNKTAAPAGSAAVNPVEPSTPSAPPTRAESGSPTRVSPLKVYLQDVQYKPTVALLNELITSGSLEKREWSAGEQGPKSRLNIENVNKVPKEKLSSAMKAISELPIPSTWVSVWWTPDESTRRLFNSNQDPEAIRASFTISSDFDGALATKVAGLLKDAGIPAKITRIPTISLWIIKSNWQSLSSAAQDELKAALKAIGATEEKLDSVLLNAAPTLFPRDLTQTYSREHAGHVLGWLKQNGLVLEQQKPTWEDQDTLVRTLDVKEEAAAKAFSQKIIEWRWHARPGDDGISFHRTLTEKEQWFNEKEPRPGKQLYHDTTSVPLKPDQVALVCALEVGPLGTLPGGAPDFVPLLVIEHRNVESASSRPPLEAADVPRLDAPDHVDRTAKPVIAMLDNLQTAQFVAKPLVAIPNVPTPTSQIPDGYRVYTLRDDGTSTSLAMLQKDDLVDVLVTYDADTPSGRKPRTAVFLERIRVFAVSNKERHTESSPKEAADQSRLISIVVMPDDVAILKNPKVQKLLTWHNPNDTESRVTKAARERLVAEILAANDPKFEYAFIDPGTGSALDLPTEAMKSNGASGAPNRIKWETNLTATLARAKSENQPVFVFPRAEWSGPDKQMWEKTLQSPAVMDLLQRRFLTVSFDTSKEPEQVKTLKIEKFPTLIVLAPDSTELLRSTGMLTAMDLQSKLATALTAFDKWAGDAPIAGPVIASAHVTPTSSGDSMKIALRFRGAPWDVVIEQLAKSAGLAVDCRSLPSGSLSLDEPAPLSVSEAISLLNRRLIDSGHLLIEHDKSLICVNYETNPVRTDIIPSITVQELAARKDYELLSVIFPMTGVSVELLAKDVRQLAGPFGTVAALPSTNSIIVTDLGINLRRIAAMLKEVVPSSVQSAAARPAKSGQSIGEFKIISLENADARQMAIMLQQIIGSGDFVAVSDPRTNSVLLKTSDAELAQLAEAVLSRLDSQDSVKSRAAASANPFAGMASKPSPAGPPVSQLRETYRASSADTARAAKELRDYQAAHRDDKKSEPEIAVRKNALKQSVEKSFDARQALLKAELADLHARLAETQASLEMREQARPEIVSRRVADLLDVEPQPQELSKSRTANPQVEMAGPPSTPKKDGLAPSSPSDENAGKPFFKVYVIRYADVRVVVKSIDSIMPGVVMNADGDGQNVHVFATAAQHRKVEDYLKLLDQPAMANSGIAPFAGGGKEQNAEANAVAELEGIWERQGGPAGGMSSLYSGVDASTGMADPAATGGRPRTAEKQEPPTLVISKGRAAYFVKNQRTRLWSITASAPDQKKNWTWTALDGKDSLKATYETGFSSGSLTLVGTGENGLVIQTFYRALSVVPDEWAKAIAEPPANGLPSPSDNHLIPLYPGNAPPDDSFKRSSSAPAGSSPVPGAPSLKTPAEQFRETIFGVKPPASNSASPTSANRQRLPSDYLPLLKPHRDIVAKYQIQLERLGAEHPEIKAASATRSVTDAKAAIELLKSEYEAQINEAKNEVARCESELKVAKEKELQTERLIEKGVVSRAELNQLTSKREVAALALESADATLNLFVKNQETLFPKEPTEVKLTPPEKTEKKVEPKATDANFKAI